MLTTSMNNHIELNGGEFAGNNIPPIVGGNNVKVVRGNDATSLVQNTSEKDTEREQKITELFQDIEKKMKEAIGDKNYETIKKLNEQREILEAYQRGLDNIPPKHTPRDPWRPWPDPYPNVPPVPMPPIYPPADNRTQPRNNFCPTCGRCLHCGRSRYCC